MRLVLIILFITYALPLTAQQSTAWHPWVIADGGAVWASYGPGGDLRLQGGLQGKGWQLGAGLALDEYRFHSMPLYAQTRKYFTKGKRRPFVLASAGFNLATEKDRTQTNWGWDVRGGSTTIYRYGSGVYAELGAGYAFRMLGKWGYQLSLSYTRKSMTESYNGSAWSGTTAIPVVNQNIYRMNRLALRIGIRIG